MNNNSKKILDELNIKKDTKVYLDIIDEITNSKPDMGISTEKKSEIWSKISSKLPGDTSDEPQYIEFRSKFSIYRAIGYFLGGVFASAFGFYIFNSTIWTPNNNYQYSALVYDEEDSNIVISTDGVADLEGVSIANELKDSIMTLNLENSNLGDTIQTRDFGNLGGLGDESLLSGGSSIMRMDFDLDVARNVIKYKYDGGLDLDLKDSMDVYKKISPRDIIDTRSILDTLGFDSSSPDIPSIIFDRFTDSSLYEVNIDIDNDMINIVNSTARNLNDTTKEVQMLTTDEILDIVNTTIDDLGLDMSNYDIEVDNSYLELYDNYTRGGIGSRDIPTYAGVHFYQKFNGDRVFEEGGHMAGFTIQVDTQNKALLFINKPIDTDYVAQNYPTETNVENILKIANYGSRYEFNNKRNIDGNANIIEIQLSNPRVRYMRLYKYYEPSSPDYLVPAVVFDIDKDNTTISPNYVVIPLIKDLYEYDGDEIVGVVGA